MGSRLLSGAIALSVVLAQSAGAGPFYSGTIAGVFASPLLSGNVIAVGGGMTPFNNAATAVVSGAGTNTFQWGANTVGATPFSRLVFTGSTFVDQEINTPFVLGTIKYLNGTSALDTLAFRVTLTLSITGTGTFTPDSSNVSLLTTENGGVDAFADADFVSFDKFPNTFNVFEGVEASAMLIGQIVGDPVLKIQSIALASGERNGFLSNGQGIPEPGSVVLVALGFAGIAMLRRRTAKPAWLNRASRRAF